LRCIVPKVEKQEDDALVGNANSRPYCHGVSPMQILSLDHFCRSWQTVTPNGPESHFRHPDVGRDPGGCNAQRSCIQRRPREPGLAFTADAVRQSSTLWAPICIGVTRGAQAGGLLGL
jgi:hypothetical protein